MQLRNGVKMPRFGFGTAEIAPTLAEQVTIIRNAIDVGYRLLDTAFIYHTERGVGQAIRESGIDRDEFFISTKIWNGEARRGKKAIIKSFEESLRRLGTDYVDLLILHWPIPGKVVDTWRVMEELYYSGRVRALGLSNVQRYHHLDIEQNCEIMAHVQQDSYNPFCRSLYQKIFCEAHGIAFEAMSPIERGAVMKIPELTEIGNKYGKPRFRSYCDGICRAMSSQSRGRQTGPICRAMQTSLILSFQRKICGLSMRSTKSRITTGIR